jgi:hypothetical protein
LRRALIKAMPQLPVDDEERLRDAEAREVFLRRVIAYHRGWHRSHQ